MSLISGKVWMDITQERRFRANCEEIEQALFNVSSGLDWLVEHAKLGDLSWSDLQEIKDNIKTLEAKCNGNR